MTQETKNQPVDTIRYGAIRAVLWGNIGKDERPRYSVTYARSYLADGVWKDTSSFGEIDSLKLAHLIPKVLDRIAELKKADQQTDSEAEQE